MTTPIFVPDPFLSWVIKQFGRALVVGVALWLIALLGTFVFTAIGGAFESLHHACHSILALWLSLAHTFNQASLAGQFVLICLCGAPLLLCVLQCGGFFYRTRQEGKAS